MSSVGETAGTPGEAAAQISQNLEKPLNCNEKWAGEDGLSIPYLEPDFLAWSDRVQQRGQGCTA
jgi:hypothetical protein